MVEISEFDKSVCFYFNQPGPKNTKHVLKIVNEKAGELGVKKILIATCSGRTALDALAVLSPSLKVIAISEVSGVASFSRDLFKTP